MTLCLTREEPGRWFFDMTETGRTVGRCDLRANPKDEKNGHLGFLVFPEERGKGYAKEACRQMLSFAKEKGLTGLTASCREENAASARVIEAVGGRLIAARDGVRIYEVRDMKVKG